MHKSEVQNFYPQRHSFRLKGYDYSKPGFYFVTLCVQSKLHLLGDISTDSMSLNDAGQMIVKWWGEAATKFEHIQLHEFVVMPNHFHGIVEIVNTESIDKTLTGGHAGPPLQVLIQWFKTMSTNEYIRNVKNLGWERFDGRLWQRNYWEHIILNKKSLRKTKEYILNNPLLWLDDEYYS